MSFCFRLKGNKLDLYLYSTLLYCTAGDSFRLDFTIFFPRRLSGWGCHCGDRSCPSLSQSHLPRAEVKVKVKVCGSSCVLFGRCGWTDVAGRGAAASLLHKNASAQSSPEGPSWPKKHRNGVGLIFMVQWEQSTISASQQALFDGQISRQEYQSCTRSRDEKGWAGGGEWVGAANQSYGKKNKKTPGNDLNI